MTRINTILLTLLFAVAAWAQDFEVSPVLMTFTANPGEIQQQKIHLINHSSMPQKYAFKMMDYVIDDEGNKKSVPAGTTKRSCADWLTINPSVIELNPNEETDINALMTVPKDGFSTKWCMIAVQSVEEQTLSTADKSLNTGVVLMPRIIILVKQVPKSNKNYKATISDLKEVTTPKDVFRTFEATVTNIGDNIIEGKVYLSLADMKTAAEENFNSVNVTVYPDSSRKIKLQLPKQISEGSYVLAAILDYGHRTALEGTQMMLEIK